MNTDKKIQSKNRQVGSILSGKQFVLVGIGLTILLFYITGNFNINAENQELPSINLPDIKLFEPDNRTHIKKEIDWITMFEGKMDWTKHKWNDNHDEIMKRLYEKKAQVDAMSCDNMINYVMTSTKATLRAYTAHLIIEKGCVIP